MADFGKGKWEITKETEDEKLRLLHQLQSHSGYVVTDNKVATLLDVVDKRRESASDVKIVCHDLGPDTAGPPG
eukprot:2879708-Lingulodinium_polyedra.AAC.1